MRRDEGQSFSARVKQELIHLPLGKSCCQLSEIGALTQTSGHLSFRGGGSFSVSWRVENAGVARRLFLLLKRRLNVTPVLHFIQTRSWGGRRTCVLTLGPGDTRTLLDALHMAETDEDGQNPPAADRAAPSHDPAVLPAGVPAGRISGSGHGDESRKGISF